MFKKNWFNTWGGIKSSKQVHSLENLKTLHNVLSKNQSVSEQNKHLLVETLRSIAEILIWGDQNDSTVFDFFLEKNMLSFFLKIMKQKCGSYVCVQLLQTLNILFENIRDETSLYYLLSNNHVNSIIVHKFDFSDEEVMAYYISFLKTLSFKLNGHTIHFFFNENTNDFPLYTEAIKFFNHNEKMVRIAVRTLTLNVFKVEERSMLKFVGDHTAVPYFSNLVWFIGNHVLEIDACLRKPIKDQQMLIKLDDLVAEHLDHLHYLNDILLLRIDDLNEILTDHLLNRLLVPLYIYSLVAPGESQASTPKHEQAADDQPERALCRERPRISRIVSLFLLSQVFLIISYDSLVQQLVDIILNGNCKIFAKPQFIAPHETLEESLVNNLFNRSTSSKIVYEEDYQSVGSDAKLDENQNDELHNQSYREARDRPGSQSSAHRSRRQSSESLEANESKPNCSIGQLSDELLNEANSEQIKSLLMEEFFKDKPFLEALYKSFDCSQQQDDHLAVFSLSLLYAIIFNTGIKKSQLYMLNENAQLITDQLGSSKLIDHLTQTVNLSANFDSFIRPVTLELCALLLLKLCIKPEGSVLSDHHLAIIEQTRENSTSVVRNYFRNENEQLFLDLFEDEYLEYSKFKINVEYLMMDANLLIPPRQLAPLMVTNLHITRRLPYSDIEKARYALRVFFIVRNLSMRIVNESDDQLPLTNVKTLINVGDSIDLNNCNLVHCFLQLKSQAKEEGYIVILDEQLVFIEPDNQRGIGSASAKYTANLQNVDVCLDKDDSRSLLVTIRPNAANGSQSKFGALDLSALKAAGSSKHSNTNVKLLFDDYIRCKVTEQHISKGKSNVIQRKLQKIANLIDIQLESIQSARGSGSNNGLNNSQSNRSTHRTYTLYSNSSRTTLKFGTNASAYHPQSGLPVPGGAAMIANGGGGPAEGSKANSKLPAVFGKRPNNHRNRSLSASHKNSRESSKERSPSDQTAAQQVQEEIMLSEMSPKNQRRKVNSERLSNLATDETFSESLSVELSGPATAEHSK